MRIDFHTHGRLAKKLPFDKDYTDNLFRTAKNSGLDAICLTEHFNTMEFSKIYDYMEENYEKSGDMYLFEGLKIIPGMEVDAREGGHLLMIGKVSDILEFNCFLQPYDRKKCFLSTKEILDRAENYEMIKGIAHPYREGGHIPELPKEILSRFDIVDLNGKDIAEEGAEKVRAKTSMLANQIGAKMVAGSDTHQAVQYGVVWTEFQYSMNRIEELKRELEAENYSVVIKDKMSYYVNLAGAFKKALKEIHRLGGDYIPFSNCKNLS